MIRWTMQEDRCLADGWQNVSFCPVTGDWRRSVEAKNGAKADDVKTKAAEGGSPLKTSPESWPEFLLRCVSFSTKPIYARAVEPREGILAATNQSVDHGQGGEKCWEEEVVVAREFVLKVAMHCGCNGCKGKVRRGREEHHAGPWRGGDGQFGGGEQRRGAAARHGRPRAAPAPPPQGHEQEGRPAAAHGAGPLAAAAPYAVHQEEPRIEEAKEGDGEGIEVIDLKQR